MSDISIQFDGDAFEEMGRENGYFHWLASSFMVLLGYDDYKKFTKAIRDAQRACLVLNLPLDQHFQAIRKDDGTEDCKLSRFACYLVAMNGDPRKQEVAGAQLYFAMLAEAVRVACKDPEHVERVVLRQEVTDHEKSLADAAKNAGVERYQDFHNAGYMGMYNMNLWRLKDFKGVDRNRSLLDFMGKAELAANLFRISQTEEKIKKENIQGQSALEDAATTAGKKVREAMIEIGGTKPEDLAIAPDIKSARSIIKKAQKELGNIDKNKNK